MTDELLLDRVRAHLPERGRREVRMFGAVAFMVDDAMAAAAHPDGSLLIRVDPAVDQALLDRPHATRARMGSGREMGRGWIRVDAAGLRTDRQLADWLRPALDRRTGHH